jgi:hypothetical protein
MPSFVNGGPVTILGLPALQIPSALKPGNNPNNHEVPALPAQFPPSLKGQLAWSGADFVSESSFIHEVTQADRDEIDAALVHFKGKLPAPGGLVVSTSVLKLTMDDRIGIGWK